MTPPTPDFSRMFRARSIAVIGASTDTKKPSGQPLMHLRKLGYGGAVYPVNPRYAQVLDWPCYPDVAALPETPDLALIAVGSGQVLQRLEECGQRGIPFVIVITSGFSEMGPDGALAQSQLEAVAKTYGTTLLGPNCQGMISVGAGFSLGFGLPYGLRYTSGPISMTSQSGGWGNTVMMLSEKAGLGFQNYQSMGNEASTTSMDLVNWFLDDPLTGMVVSYVEGCKDAHRLVELGRKALRAGKPYLLWKVGTSDAGARAAASHTANLGGSAKLYKAAFRQGGIIEVTDVDELIDRAKALLARRRPKGPRVAVVTLSGGAGVLLADHCSARGLPLPDLLPQTTARLKAILPPYAGLNNPIDLTGNIAAREESMIECLQLVIQDPNVDMLGVCLAAASGEAGNLLAGWVAQVATQTDKPVLVAWVATHPDQTQAGFAALESAQVPRYETPVRCAIGMEALWRFVQSQQETTQIDQEPIYRLERPAMRATLAAAASDLSEFDAKKVLAAYGLPVTTEHLARDADAAVSFAKAVGYPIALKIVAADIPHKTEAGGVRLNLADAQGVRDAYDAIHHSVARYAPQAQLDGVLVQAMVTEGIELILGVQDDPLFGLAIMCGLGGIYAEVFKDVSFRLLPITRSEAASMVQDLRCFPILNGARGKPSADIEALVDAIVSLAALALDLKGQFTDIDINPLFVRPAGQGVVVGDALIKIRP